MWPSAQRAPIKGDGTYDVPLAGRSSGRFVVRAVSVDHLTSESKIVEIVESRSEYEVDLTLAEGRTLEGRVVAKGGSGVAGARVCVLEHYDQYGRMEGTDLPVWAVTDPDGGFAVPHLAPRRYDVIASAPHLAEAEILVDLARPDPVTIELLPELSIEGSVQLADGRPVEGVQVRAQKGPATMILGLNPDGPGAMTTDAKGRFRLTKLAEGTYTLTARAQWGTGANVRPKSVEGVAAGTMDVRLTVEEGGTIAGRVLDGERQPLEEVTISANPTPKKGAWTDEWNNTTTRSDGSFALVGLGQGPYNLQVGQNWGGGQGVRPVSKDAVAVGTKDLEFVLEPGLSISGTIVDADGKPVNQQLLITATRVDQDQQGASKSQNWVHNGVFTLSGLAPGNYRLELPGWGVPNATVTLEDHGTVPAGTKDVRLVAVRGVTITGTVVDDAGTPISGATINAGAKDGRDWRHGQSKDDGTFEIGGLRTGRIYNLQCNASDRVPARAADVAAGARDVKLVLARGVEASGRLVDGSEAPLRNTQLSLRQQGGDAYQSGTTDDQGRFTVKGLVAAATYEVQALLTKDGQQAWKPCGTVRAGDRSAELRVQP